MALNAGEPADDVAADPVAGAADDVTAALTDEPAAEPDTGMPSRLTPPLVLLVAANLVPLYGVLFLAWDVFAVVFLYWLENVAVGVFAVLRMLFNRTPEPLKWLQKALLIPFFAVHYGMFAYVHGMFVLILFNQQGEAVLDEMSPALLWGIIRDHGLIVPAAVLAASHAFSLVWLYLIKGECRRTYLIEEQSRPYRRVVVLHVTIIGGGFLIQMLGSPAWALALLVLLKVGADLVAHSRSHRRAEIRGRRQMARLYRMVEMANAAVREGEVPDSLVQRFPGYVRDRAAGKRLNRRLGGLCLGGLATGVLGGAGMAAAGQRILAGIVIGIGLVAFVVGLVLYNIRRRIPCAVCGRPMEVVDTSMTLAEMSKSERLAAGGTPVGAEQRWYVCHPCKLYFLGRKVVSSPGD
ncbi:MAG TPA: DUF6498-containing protein [Phycisphaerae bacterium]|nr:DUF6498-containing protein [Phycisphaerae bacterium]